MVIDATAAALEVQELETDTGRIIKLADIFRTGEAEQAYFWKDHETGLDCRCKADWMIGDILLDYKSTRDARLHQFRRQVGGLRYHMRAAFYIDGITAVTGKVLEGVKITRCMVKAEGWDKNSKWKNMEQQMFQYRAAAFFGRVNCPQLLMGYHTADEIEDTVKDVTPRVSEGATDDLAAAAGSARG